MPRNRELEDSILMMPPRTMKNKVPGKPGGNPIFPGTQLGATIKQVRNWIKKQKRSRGFAFDVPVGTTPFNIDISGTARIFLGFAFIQADEDFADQATMTFLINNEVVIEDVFMSFFSNEFTDEEYYSFPRPLSGTDSVTLRITAPTAQQVRMIIYYI